MTETSHGGMVARRGEPTPPIAFEAPVHNANTVAIDPPTLDDAFLERVRATGAAVDIDHDARAEVGRDWWPLAMTWALDGATPGIAGAIVRPTSETQLSAVLALCNEAQVPVTPAAGRSGVCGGSIPAFGGVQLDMTAFAGIRELDATSGILDVGAGTFGDVLEDELRESHGVTLGHWPQSIALSTVGGWLACRSAGQLSNRYGKIEDIVLGLDVVLANGRVVTTAGGPRRAVGPDLNQVFVGSEGTLGLITGARLRVRPLPLAERRAAYTFATFTDGLEACRLTARQGTSPAVMRLYDATEAQRNFGIDSAVIIALDEGTENSVTAVMADAHDACLAAGGVLHDDGAALVERWLGHRNNVAQLESLVRRDLVVDTIEISGAWAQLPAIYAAATAALMAIDGTVVASAHQSHAYPDGACLYFTFAAMLSFDGLDRSQIRDAKTQYYRAAWDAATRAVLAHGGALSHHHGVGLNRSRFMPEALGSSFDVLVSLKQALDPRGILNPGKLGLPNPFGTTRWDPPRSSPES